ncbi:MAG: ankyrin repeat domain-containing protein [Endomicrobium sp.]|jgi:ankyrin repeat protein|nr:ankyrin repeat domain-containing protein [Endomicrobium sp.]
MSRFFTVLTILFVSVFVCAHLYAQDKYKPLTKDFEQAVIDGNFEDVKYYLNKAGTDFSKRQKLLNMKFKNKSFALMTAAKAGNYDIVKFLISNGADVNASSDKDFAFSAALSGGNKDIVKLFTDTGRLKDDVIRSALTRVAEIKGSLEKIKIAQTLPGGINRYTPYILSAAAKSADKEVIEYALSNGADLNDKIYEEILTRPYKGLISASGNKEFVEYILSDGVNLNDEFSGGVLTYPIAEAVCASYEGKDKIEIINYLRSKGADIFAAAYPLMIYSVKSDDAELLKYLVLNKIDPNISGRSGTPFTAAILYGKKNSFQYFVENGADVNAAFPMVFKTIKDDNSPETEREAKASELIEKFDAHNARLVLINGYANALHGMTPLMLAVYKGEFEMAKTLIENGADVDAFTLSGLTPLCFAAIVKDAKTAKYLIEKGADINLKNEKGQSPLLFASSNNDFDMVKLLVENGADISVKDKKGVSAHKITKSKEIQNYLKDKGVSKKSDL